MCSSHQGQLRRVRCQKRPTKQHPLQALLSPPTRGLQEGCSAKYKKRRARRQRRSLAKPAEMRPPKQYNRNETRRRRAAPCWEVLGDPQKRNSATGERCWRWCLHPRRARPVFERGRDPIVLGTVPRAAFCERRCLQRRQGESRGHFTFALVAACEEKGAAAYASRPSETSGGGDASAHTHTHTHWARVQALTVLRRVPFLRSGGISHGSLSTITRPTARRSVPGRPRSPNVVADDTGGMKRAGGEETNGHQRNGGGARAMQPAAAAAAFPVSTPPRTHTHGTRKADGRP